SKEAINFHINVWVWSAIVGFLTFISFGLLGFVLLPLLLLVYCGLAVWAIFHTLTQPDTAFRYPFILRLL
ncbi:MAG: DUF4870 domain-containing protein, partial [Elainellaceae cyanobacterium]